MLSFTVIDLADEEYAFATRALADLGAIVLRLERRGSHKITPTYIYRNLNKHIMAIDLEREEGLDVLFRLLKRADVLVDGIRRLAADLTKQRPTEVNPKLVHVSMRGVQGRKGEGEGWDDYVVSALSGQMVARGSRDDPPVPLPAGQNHYILSLYAAIAVLLALERREKEGKGIFVELDIEECAVTILEDALIRYVEENRAQTGHDQVSREDLFCTVACRDGYVQVPLLYSLETLLEWMAQDGIKVVDRAEGTRYDAVRRAVKEWAAIHSVGELFETGQAMRLPFAPIVNPLDLPRNLHLRRTGFLKRIKTEIGDLYAPSMPYRFSKCSRKLTFRRPGTSNEWICKGLLGLSEEEFRKLEEAKVF